MSIRPILIAGILSVLAVPAALAAQEGDPEAGRVKAYTCTGCHGITGYVSVYPTHRVPKIGGQHAEYIVSALRDYREGKRDHPTMEAQANRLSDQDIADIAAYFSTVGE